MTFFDIVVNDGARQLAVNETMTVEETYYDCREVVEKKSTNLT
jgi:hypothetical protein